MPLNEFGVWTNGPAPILSYVEPPSPPGYSADALVSTDTVEWPVSATTADLTAPKIDITTPINPVDTQRQTLELFGTVDRRLGTPANANLDVTSQLEYPDPFLDPRTGTVVLAPPK